MSADHIGDASNMIAPVEFWGCADGNGIDPRLVFADRADAANVAAGLGLTVQPLYTHPTPIKPSADTVQMLLRGEPLTSQQGDE